MDPVRPAQPPTDVACNDPIAGPPPPTPDAIARAIRALADTKRDAFASGHVPQPGDCDYFEDGASHDFDRCLEGPVSNSTLYLTQTGDVDAVAPPDVEQGEIGDCALMATLSALASTPEGRAVIKRATVENRNDEGKVTSYTVTLHRPETHAIFFTTFSDVKITVSPQFVTGHAIFRTQCGVNELWPAVIEKAFAQYVGGYNQLTTGSHADISMTLLTGNLARSVAPAGYSAKQLKGDLAAGKLVVLETNSAFENGNSFDLLNSHAYSVTGTEIVNGELYVTMRNPWGLTHPPPVPYAKLSQWFSAVDIGTVR